MTYRHRSGALYLGQPAAPHAPLGTCKWCGATLTGKNAHRRNVCYVEREGRPCRRERNRSVVWSARDAVILAAECDGHAELRCTDCDRLCQHREPAPERAWLWNPYRQEAEPRLWTHWQHDAHWEADHEIPLWNDGPHELANLRCRCDECHKAKTAREAAERAARRRGDPWPPPEPPPDPQLGLL